MVSKKKFMTSVATSLAIASIGLTTVGQVAPAIGPHVQVAQAATSAINNYITNNNIKPVSITNQEGTFNIWQGYENGVGKPEGVVIHETATPGATAQNEATYFNREWSNMYSYVHAFVDANEILNIKNTDYAVWGAGPTANAKFVQVELCEVSTTDAFARSVANQAYYTASKLVQYNLPFTPGVTVMSHNDVSRKWGETTHTDPVGYFAKWGYSMDQFYDLVSKYYNQLKGTTNSGSENNNNTANEGSSDIANTNVIKVSNSKGSYVPLVAFQNDGSTKNITNRALANNSPWYTDQFKVSNDGVTYRRVATNEWVDNNYVVG
ncbi:N-acetylmuramoyl-L-alanine amidase family protein [Companilactobacillus halodurans]|uniref:N-acetylmuramoyl-L-alanine amidase n=1 Tax=Companilactobacillus halodurans TaxID=2584183 RepID=A0A5P0ZU55_9LACO|nr:peptidoglycan recognition family protein [Companilactobacillus halodurans]MQS76256.1 N-acetylmuramoyl-L-alanine amidase [Companilactobacillus halodurans]MQS96616.1 N-acetylmuramoyl-L-alanine amidase [Companilactobacillus halodurans]